MIFLVVIQFPQYLDLNSVFVEINWFNSIKLLKRKKCLPDTGFSVRLEIKNVIYLDY